MSAGVASDAHRLGATSSSPSGSGKGEELWRRLCELDPTVSRDEFIAEDGRFKSTLIERDKDFLDGKIEQPKVAVAAGGGEEWSVDEWDTLLEVLETRAKALTASILRLQEERGNKWAEGFQKFCRRVKTELRFIQTLKGKKKRQREVERARFVWDIGTVIPRTEDDEPALLKAQYQSSNVPYLYGVHECIRHLPGVVAIATAKGFGSKKTPELADGDGEGSENNNRTVPIDVIACNGNLWVKVRASRGVRLWMPGHDSSDAADDDQKVLDLAKKLVAAAQQNPNAGKVPKIAIALIPGTVHAKTVEALTKTGVATVWFGAGKASEECPPSDGSSIPSGASTPTPTIRTYSEALQKASSELGVNLDVTAIIALCSDLCQERKDEELKRIGADFQHVAHHIRAIAEDERVCPALPLIRAAMRGRRVFVTETAKACAERIFKTLGGSKERNRFEELAKMVTIIPDAPYERIMNLKSKKIKLETRRIFSTSVKHDLITLTSNTAFVRSTRQAGINLQVSLHPARALVGHMLQI
eukprot:CAMPEP_0114538592 /NCGR_PEP_ID=MMETSP0109-20121206/30227_1 /TAXON_ID=29199 /ORGANISM="Chlorarachnion reptans, Strain CCCM449" /LENGTH=529 /DNA_ID=CAMNT_0001722625 /DNA_START=28 /DNA_END=1616 /DNA_ORIENTATION=-